MQHYASFFSSIASIGAIFFIYYLFIYYFYFITTTFLALFLLFRCSFLVLFYRQLLDCLSRSCSHRSAFPLNRMMNKNSWWACSEISNNSINYLLGLQQPRWQYRALPRPPCINFLKALTLKIKNRAMRQLSVPFTTQF